MSAAHNPLERTWQNLPDDVEWTRHQSEYPGEMLEALTKAANIYEHDYAAASAILGAFVRTGAILAVRNADQSITYTKADRLPDPPQPLDWVEEQNKELLARHQDNLRRQAEGERTRNAFFNPPSPLQQMAARLEALETAVTEIRRQIGGAETDNAPVGAQEVVSV